MGIFAEKVESDEAYMSIPHFYPCIFFHGQYKNKNKILRQFISKKEIPNFETILVCDERNAIYAEHDGQLYGLKFSDIFDTDFQFTIYGLLIQS